MPSAAKITAPTSGMPASRAAIDRAVLDGPDQDVLGVPADHRGRGGQDGQREHRAAQPGVRPVARVAAGRDGSGLSGVRGAGLAGAVAGRASPVAAGLLCRSGDGHRGCLSPAAAARLGGLGEARCLRVAGQHRGGLVGR